MSLVDQIKQSIIQGKTFKYDPNKDYEKDEEEKKKPWSLEAITNLTSNNDIIESLTNDEEYTYGSAKSKAEFRKLFYLLCKTEEEILFEKLMSENS